jgi:aminopeptidase
MDTELDKRIRAYADLLIDTGLNLQKGQELVISCPVECAPFARICATAAYKRGAREVFMNWSDDHMTREKYLNADSSVFDSFPEWRADFYNTLSGRGCAWLSIHAEDPEALRGVDPDRLLRANISSGKAIRPFRDRQTANFFPWCVASAPVASWAEKVFPSESGDAACDKLWAAILDSSRVTPRRPVTEWAKHTETLKKTRRGVNSYNFNYLHMKLVARI